MKCARQGCPVPVASGGRFCSVHRAAEDPSDQVAAGASLTCAVPSCGEPRFSGENFCLRHGPRKRSSASTPAAPSTAQVLCPHCLVRGHVTRQQIKVKRGVSGGKVTGAVLTAGFSILGTGLSRKQNVTEMHCSNCGTTWHVE